MSDKIKRLAKNVTELLTNTETPQDTYYSLVHLMRKQKDYFQHISPENIVKLIFYCYSFAKTKDFALSDKMLNEIAFAVLFNNSGDNHKDECDVVEMVNLVVTYVMGMVEWSVTHVMVQVKNNAKNVMEKEK